VSLGGDFKIDLSTASDDTQLSCGAAGGRDVFFELNLPSAEVVYVDTYGGANDLSYTDHPSVIGLRRGSCVSAGMELACQRANCDATHSVMAKSLEAGTYCLIVDQDGPRSQGHTVITVRRGGRAGLEIPVASGSYSGNTCNQSDLSTGCGTGSAPDVAYFFARCATSFDLSASTCNNGTDFPSAVSIRQGSALDDALVCDGSACALGGTGTTKIYAPALCWIIVDGYTAGACGNYAVTVNLSQ
jgi:hypothetical protein